MNPMVCVQFWNIFRYALHVAFAVYILLICVTALVWEHNRRFCWPRWRKKLYVGLWENMLGDVGSHTGRPRVRSSKPEPLMNDGSDRLAFKLFN